MARIFTEVGRSARHRLRQPTLAWTTVQPKVDLHAKPSILHGSMQLARPRKIDLAANCVQRSAAAGSECPVSFHRAVHRLAECRHACPRQLPIDEPEIKRCVVSDEKLV